MRPSQPNVAQPPPQFVELRQWVSQPVMAAFCGGGVAGAVSRTVVSPLERLKILLQVQSVGREAYKLSVGQALAKMWREEGWRGFMRGNGTNCIRIVPYSAVQFSSYNFYKRVCYLALSGPAWRKLEEDTNGRKSFISPFLILIGTNRTYSNHILGQTYRH